eukprot:Nk52_evm11s2273 gene=Nk52_evmTU11s2273
MAVTEGTSKVVTCSAPVNIAVIKYWGKRNEDIILPINSSLSGTLNQASLKTTTSAMYSTDFTEDCIWLNGTKQDVNNKRIQSVLRAIKEKALQKHSSSESSTTTLIPSDTIRNAHVHICSENSFPTAAGLASSASGYACMVATLAKLYGLWDGVENNSNGDITMSALSQIARVGSGSACRSMFGGFVAWEAGVEEDGSDSLAVQVTDEHQWPEMEVLVCVVSDSKKSTSSTSGMQTTVNTSELIEHRAKEVVPRRMKEIEKAIKEKDFETFGKITMQDSNQFHACCMDTYPPIYYMNDVSKFLVRLVTEFNRIEGGIKAAYTFDAGPNAVIYALKDDMKKLVAIINAFFKPQDSKSTFYRGMDAEASAPELKEEPTELLRALFKSGTLERELVEGKLKYLIHTNLGPGPLVVTDEKQHLLEQSTGMPAAQVE